MSSALSGWLFWIARWRVPVAATDDGQGRPSQQGHTVEAHQAADGKHALGVGSTEQRDGQTDPDAVPGDPSSPPQLTQCRVHVESGREERIIGQQVILDPVQVVLVILGQRHRCIVTRQNEQLVNKQPDRFVAVGGRRIRSTRVLDGVRRFGEAFVQVAKGVQNAKGLCLHLGRHPIDDFRAWSDQPHAPFLAVGRP